MWVVSFSLLHLSFWKFPKLSGSHLGVPYFPLIYITKASILAHQASLNYTNSQVRKTILPVSTKTLRKLGDNIVGQGYVIGLIQSWYLTVPQTYAGAVLEATSRCCGGLRNPWNCYHK